jgi:hypothetical protein
VKIFSSQFDALAGWLLAPSTAQRLGYALTELELVLREMGARYGHVPHGRAWPTRAPH